MKFRRLRLRKRRTRIFVWALIWLRWFILILKRLLRLISLRVLINRITKRYLRSIWRSRFYLIFRTIKTWLITIEWIIVLIILLYEIAFVKTRRSDSLKRSFRRIPDFSMSVSVDSLFIFIIIKNREKSIYDNEILKFLDVSSKFKIKIIIYNVELIFDESHLCIFN